MKWILSIILLLCFTLCLFGLSACDCEHKQSQESVIIEASCTQTGLKTTTCKDCGKTLENQTLPKLAHQESEWITDVEPNCKQAGLRHKECLTCHAVLQVDGVNTEYKHTYVYGECSVCGNIDDTYMTYGLIYALTNNDSEYEVVAYNGASVQVIIPATYKGKPVTSIKANAFADCAWLVSVKIPSSVVAIGANAFAGCENLTIYCDMDSKPSSWDSSWNSSNCKVFWNGKEENSGGSNTVNPPSGWFD